MRPSLKEFFCRAPQAGFGLAEVLMTAGLLGILSVSFFRMSESRQKIQARVVDAGDLEDLRYFIRRNFDCRRTLDYVASSLCQKESTIQGLDRFGNILLPAAESGVAVGKKFLLRLRCGPSVGEATVAVDYCRGPTCKTEDMKNLFPNTPISCPTESTGAVPGLPIIPGKLPEIIPNKPSPNSNPPTFPPQQTLDEGVPVIRAGINFEDGGAETHPTIPAKPDYDYNDGVLCFSGNFKVLGGSVVSTKPQTVVGQLSNISACGNTLRIEVRTLTGAYRQPPMTVKLNSREIKTVSLGFQYGDQLFVSMEKIFCPWLAGGKMLVTERNYTMGNRLNSVVMPDVCNQTGQ